MTKTIVPFLLTAAVVAALSGAAGAQSAAGSDPHAPAKSVAPLATLDTERLQVRLAEVMSILEEEDLSPELKEQALAKLKDVSERLRKSGRLLSLGGLAAVKPKVVGLGDDVAVVEGKGGEGGSWVVDLSHGDEAAEKAAKRSGDRKAKAEAQAKKVYAEAKRAHAEALEVHEKAMKAHGEAHKAHVDAHKAHAAAEEAEARAESVRREFVRVRTPKAVAGVESPGQQGEAPKVYTMRTKGGETVDVAIEGQPSEAPKVYTLRTKGGEAVDVAIEGQSGEALKAYTVRTSDGETVDVHVAPRSVRARTRSIPPAAAAPVPPVPPVPPVAPVAPVAPTPPVEVVELDAGSAEGRAQGVLRLARERTGQRNSAGVAEGREPAVLRASGMGRAQGLRWSSNSAAAEAESDAELRATIDEMRAEMRAIRAMMQEMRREAEGADEPAPKKRAPRNAK